MQWIKFFGWLIMIAAIGQVIELKKHAEKKDSFAMLVDIGYILMFGFVALSMILSYGGTDHENSV